MCLMKIVKSNREYMSKWANLKFQETRSIGDSPNQIWTKLEKNLSRWIYEPTFITICTTVWEKLRVCSTKIANSNSKYRSQRPYLNKLELGSTETLQTTKYKLFQVSGFIEDFWRIGQTNTHNSMKNRDSTPILTNLVRVHPVNIHTIWSESVLRLRRSRKRSRTTTTDTGWSLESHSLIECDWK